MASDDWQPITSIEWTWKPVYGKARAMPDAHIRRIGRVMVNDDYLLTEEHIYILPYSMRSRLVMPQWTEITPLEFQPLRSIIGRHNG